MRGFRLGKVAGFEINIDWSWLIIFTLVIYSLAGFYFPRVYPGLSSATNWIMGVIAAILLFVSVLAHELMHSVVAKQYGIDIKGITLFIFGGMSQTGAEPGTPKAEFNMAVIGPVTSFVIAAVFYGVTVVGNGAGWPVPVVAITGYLAVINLILGIFNMVPGFPLDGGRVLRSGLWAWLDNLERATRYASYVGQGFGYLLMGFGFFNLLGGALIGGFWMIFIGWFLAGSARTSYEQVLLRQALSGVEVSRVMTTDVPVIEARTPVDDFVQNYLMRREYACYPVAENEQVKGIVGIGDVRSLPREQWQFTTVGEITHPIEEEMRVSKDDDAWDALLKLATDENSCRLLVMQNGNLEGTITQDNIFRLIRTKMQLGV
ncbi:MAG: site-2 protease family protein [Armatimonadetes bacterium]|nr:site-2 protease family protein [Armatimonadota bacterium]